jgi:hypothetical protein
MKAVIQADADDGQGLERGERLHHLGWAVSDAEVAKDVSFNGESAAIRLKGGVGDATGGISVADDFHAPDAWAVSAWLPVQIEGGMGGSIMLRFMAPRPVLENGALIIASRRVR